MTRTGQLELRLGTERAAERAEAWTEQARSLIVDWRWGRITSDDVTNALGLPPGSHNAVGALFRTLAKEGVLIAVDWTTSGRAERRGSAIRVWERR